VTLLIRPASADDADELALLAEVAFGQAYGSLIDAATIDTVVRQACTRTAFRGLVAARQWDGHPEWLLVATDGTALLGFLDFAEEDDGLELRRLYTRVGATSRGVGAALLSELESALPPGTRYRIVVVAGNVRGLRFWQRHGFRVSGEVDGRAHFRSHRGIAFDEVRAPVTLLLLDRTVGAPPPGEAHPDA
jgi:GNAT superfamily N-acetyltransferase